MSGIENIERAYDLARQRYADLGVNTESALQTLQGIALSIHCWQGDDVGGFERPDARLSGGGIQVTGNYPGKARTLDELRMDLAKAYSLIPGRHRLNLHAIYGDFGGRIVDRDQVQPEHFQSWIDWAKLRNLKIDFNSSCFSHPKADGGFTLSSRDTEIRKFWIGHITRCRAISAVIGRELGSPCIHNLWIPDGLKDSTVDRWGYRKTLKESLDEIFAREYSVAEMKDSIESKLFGIGTESFVVGSHEFYIGYALSRKKIPCLDMGHFHPTESVADKISSILQFSDEILLHISRGVRWDSDHVVTLNDEVRSVAEEIIRADALRRTHLALDYFDASLNRIGAWVIGARATLKALLLALLEPRDKLMEFELRGNGFARLALQEEVKTLPFGAVWDHYCLKMDVPAGEDWTREVWEYEQEVMSKRL